MATASTKTAYTKGQLEEMAASVGFWWHSIDLGQGVVTKGHKTREFLARELESLRLPDLKNRTVLDIGAYDGFYSFEAERRGARRVVALDHYVWSMDLPNHIRYWTECKERGVVPPPNEQKLRWQLYWQPDKLPGKHGYDAAYKALGSEVETVIGDFMTMDLEPLGTFDVVFFLGVLYHMENPLVALKRVASLTKNVAIIETHAIRVPDYDDLELCEFYSSTQLAGDPSNWWGPNLKALEGMCHAAGFSRVEIMVGHVEPRRSKRSIYRRARGAAGQVLREFSLLPPRPPSQREYFRAVAHAWK
jgi:tRNA (mo5U34)-methyltransferase